MLSCRVGQIMAGSKRAFFAGAMLLSLLIAFAATGQTPTTTIQPDNANVHITHLAAISTTQTYDPQNPSHDMPAPSADEAGVTVADFSCSAKVWGTILGQTQNGRDTIANVRVDSVDISLQLKIAEWISQSAPQKMWSHEGGHRIIAEHFYAGADGIAAAIGHGMIGREFSGSGPDANSAANAALTSAASEIASQYMTEVRDPSEEVQEIYDRITAHGTNGIDEIDAITQSLNEAQEIGWAHADRGEPAGGSGGSSLRGWGIPLPRRFWGNQRGLSGSMESMISKTIRFWLEIPDLPNSATADNIGGSRAIGAVG